MRFIARISWILVLAQSLASGAVADYQTSYGQGLQALEREQWSEAADWFRKAIEERPEAGGKVSVSGKKHLYVPYFQLGLALYSGGDYWEASEAWRKSATQGVLRKKDQERVDEYLFDIEKRLQSREESPDVEPVPQLSAQELEGRRKSAKRQLDRADRHVVKLAAPDLRTVLDADPELVVGRDQGLAKLRRARQIYETAGVGGDPIALEEALEEVHALAGEAAGELGNVVLRASLKLEPEAAEPSPIEPPVEPEVPPIVAGEETPPIATPADTPLTPPIATPADTPLTPPIATPADTPLTPPEAPPGAIVEESGPPNFLRQAATAFFSARYDDVLSVLHRAGRADSRVQKHAHLFRAAALYTLYVLGDRRDAAGLKAAEDEVRACRAIDSGLRPPIEGFSPSFVRFFASAG